MTDFDTLAALERRVLWLASWTIHAANHLRPADDLDVKVGGHQASCASMATLMTALYFHTLRPEDRVAVIATQALTDNEAWMTMQPGTLWWFEEGFAVQTLQTPPGPEKKPAG